MENYIVINGKKAELTKEQLEKLGIKPERNNPFDRVKKNGKYYRTLNSADLFKCEVDHNTIIDRSLYNCADYFNDKEFAEQMSLKWLLNRKLEKYAWDNEAEDVEWNGKNSHYYIYYHSRMENFYIDQYKFCKSCTTVYFRDREVAKNAIKDVIEPFMSKHPNFKW